MGAMVVSERWPSRSSRRGRSSRTASRSAAIRSPRRSRWRNLDVLEGDDLLGHVPPVRARAARDARRLRALPLVGDVRGAGYFWGIELVADQASRRRFEPAAAHALCAASSRPSSSRRGLICRATDRGYPVIQLAPPLIAGPEQFDEIGAVLHDVLTLACERMGMG